MAILFKQSKRKERIFIWSIIIFVITVLFLISLVMFPPFQKVLPPSENGISSQYDAKIDLGLMDSEQVKNLYVFLEGVKIDFSFIAQDKNGKRVTGNISALDKDEAMSLLIAKELTVVSITELYSIKNDPFSPYYKSQ